MAERTAVEKAVLAALEREPAVNLHRWPVRVEYDIVRRALTLEGEVENIIAKRRAYACVGRVDGVDGTMDRLRVRPSEPRGDGAIRTSITQSILDEPSLRDCALHVQHKDIMETLRVPPGSKDTIGVTVVDGVVELTGHIGSLSHKQLTGVLAWWAPGCRDVLNVMKVEPPEAINDGEITDALRLVLEKDPLMPHADDIGISVREYAVTLSGIVINEEERRQAEYNAWYLVGVRDVVNRIEVRRQTGRTGRS
jgi:osmotically-inducible protein OsmY